MQPTTDSDTPPGNLPVQKPQVFAIGTDAHGVPFPAPDHTQLPDEDGTFVHNYQEHPQSNLLTSSILPRLRDLHPDGQFSIGQDSGIYYRLTNPPLEGCRAPDWFYVPGVPPMLDGQLRRSYVMWMEGVRPALIMEFASGDGGEERDATPGSGKFWIYERAIAAGYYAIFVAATASIELYQLVANRYAPVPPNDAGRYPIDTLGVELGVWQGRYRELEAPWMRFWDSATGVMIPSEEERTELQKHRAETAESLADDYRQQLAEETQRTVDERQRAAEAQRAADEARHRAEEQRRQAEDERQHAAEAQRAADDARRLAEDARQRAARLAERLRELGIDPDAA